MNKKILIYGANGFTGKLIVQEAITSGLDFSIAGRNADKIREIALEYDLNYYIFGVNDQDVDTIIQNYWLLLNCAGPFSSTAKPMIASCLNTGTHYADITGEIDIFEYANSLHYEAEQANVVLLPGIGFDVVPTDCLALYLKDRMPDASTLELAFYNTHDSPSIGTTNTTIEGIKNGIRIRENGVIRKIGWGQLNKEIKFSNGKTRFMTAIPWGDLSTAYHTTGISEITVYGSINPKLMKRYRRMNKFMWILGTKPFQNYLKKKALSLPNGPSNDALDSSRVYIHGIVTNKNGYEEAWMETPNGYAFTSNSAIVIINKIKAKSLKGGYYTPASAFGINLYNEMKGTILQTSI